MNKYTLLFILIFLQQSLFSAIKTEIKVLLFSSHYGSNAVVSPVDGTFYILSAGKTGAIIDTVAVIDADNEKRSRLSIKYSKGRISLSRNNKPLGNYNQLVLKAKNYDSSFLIKYANLKERIYDGSLLISTKETRLQIINSVNLDSYVAGVVESEVGSSGNKEFYKVQAILARTYAIKNYNKFIKEGYNLTDDVRSQVYLSKAYFMKNKMIHEAVRETKNLVIVDRGDRLIDAAFHASSGGETLNSGTVWIRNVNYLKGKEDPYSLKTSRDSLYWTKKIPKEKYLNYFYRKAPSYQNDSEYKKAILSFTQDRRKSNFEYKNKSIRLKDLREEFNLRSSFFDVEEKRNFVILKGKGHGHGVGLSQIGAFNMAKSGYSFVEIIQYYYNDVDVVNFSKVKS